MIVSKPIHLIVNADDYGYFPCISQGIVEAAKAGALTATGIMANSPDLKTQLGWLDAVEGLDLGVHLNLTSGRPVTAAMADKLSYWNGCFPGKYLMSLMILTGKIRTQDVVIEWRAQIEACRHKKLLFLNSHEHIHMLPILFPLALSLAQDYEIPHVRFTQAEWLGSFNAPTLVRNTLMQAMQCINRHRTKLQAPLFLGLNRSGKLDYDYLATIFAKLKPGESYELMCHPGRLDPAEITDSRLRSYHDWEGELTLLKSQNIHALYEKFNIRLSRYQHLE